MAREALLSGEWDGDGDEMDQLRQSIGKFSSVLRARKAAQAWRHKSWKKTGGFDEEQQCSSSSGSSSWRLALGSALDSTPAHIVIVALLLIDLLATAVDLLLTIHNTSADLRECASTLQACQCSAGDEFSRRESWEFLHWISVGILCVLLLNVIGLMVAFGAAFFRHAGYVLDLFVVTSAFILEVFFEADTAGLLIILNLWRIVRVAHGIFEVTDEAWENEIDEMKEKLESVETRYKRECQLKDQTIMKLQSELHVIKGLSATSAD